MVKLNESLKTVADCLKATPCFRRLVLALAGSHSNCSITHLMLVEGANIQLTRHETTSRRLVGEPINLPRGFVSALKLWLDQLSLPFLYPANGLKLDIIESKYSSTNSLCSSGAS